VQKLSTQAAPQPASDVREHLPERTGATAFGAGHLAPMGAYRYVRSPLPRREAAAGRSGLPDNLKAGIEGLSGLALDHVKVHYNSARPAQLRAHAYAQGSDIHLAPGQERRLPHEAWHLVQQAQGRVEASGQDRGVALNEDRRLEQEADVMGARAMRRGPAAPIASECRAAAPAAMPVTQLYRIEREPVTTRVYSVSNDNSMVTGMATPNHDFYVGNATQIGAMNNAISASPLLFYAAGTARLFGRDYYRVGLSFDTARVRGGAPDDRRAPRQDNLQALYRDQVLPEIRAFREGRRAGKTAEIDAAAVVSDGQVNPAFINPALAASVRRLELFKKLILSQLTLASYRDDEPGAIADAGQIVATLESALYSTDITRGDIAARLEQLAPYFRAEENLARFARTPILRATLLELRAAVAALAAALPVDLPVDLMSFHNAGFQARQVEAVDGPDNVLLYRACDVTAATLLGNKITEQNAQRLKTYVAGSGGAFHYATKILQSGGDWVTLEGFAASDRERGIIGIEDDDSAKNVDDTWQYIMYGALAGDGDPLLSDEDRYFALYTKLRYYLKGITAPGVFGPTQRAKLIPKPIDLGRLEALFPLATGVGGFFSRLVTDTPQEKAQALFRQLQTTGLLDRHGSVAERETLTLQKLRKLLPSLPEGIAVKVFRILRESLKSQHIQIGLSSDLANAIAWRAYLGADGGEQAALLRQQSDAIMEQGIDPRAQSGATWDDLAQTVARLPPRPVVESEPPVLGPQAGTPLTASEPLKASKPVKDENAPKGKQPPARHELVALGLRELDRLRELWRSRQPQPALGSPPNYLDWRAAIQSIPLAPEDMPIGAIQEDLMQWLSHAREKWGV